MLSKNFSAGTIKLIIEQIATATQIKTVGRRKIHHAKMNVPLECTRYDVLLADGTTYEIFIDPQYLYINHAKKINTNVTVVDKWLEPGDNFAGIHNAITVRKNELATQKRRATIANKSKKHEK